MGWWAFVAGWLVLLFLATDVLWTTLGQGAGPLTRAITGGFWSAGLWMHHRLSPRHTRLSTIGIAGVLTALAAWILLLWTGWTLVFLGERAALGGPVPLPIGFWDRVWFTGYTVFTLGAGSIQPSTPFWQVLTAIASFSGLFVVTFAITYLVPVVQATTHKRTLAVFLSGLGSSPQEMLVQAWDGQGFPGLMNQLTGLGKEVALLQQRHLAYPVLHYFHSHSPEEAVSLRIAALDEALTLMEHGLAPELVPVSSGWRPARHGVAALLATLHVAFIKKGAPPPAPDLEPLRRAGIPVVDDAEFLRRLEVETERRSILRGFVEADGWSWDQLGDKGGPG